MADGDGPLTHKMTFGNTRQQTPRDAQRARAGIVTRDKSSKQKPGRAGDKNDGGKNTPPMNKGKSVKESVMETQTNQQPTRIPTDPHASDAKEALRKLLGSKDISEAQAFAAAIALSSETLAAAIAGQSEVLKAHLEEVRKTYAAAEAARAKQIEDESLPKELLRTAANVGVAVTLTGGLALLFNMIWPGNVDKTAGVVASVKK